MQSTEYFCLATGDKDSVWASPVYFAWDEKFNLYFLSQPHSRHMKNLEKDRRGAISIYSTAQSAFGDVAGIQLDGKAYILTDKREIEKHTIPTTAECPQIPARTPRKMKTLTLTTQNGFL